MLPTLEKKPEGHNPPGSGSTTHSCFLLSHSDPQGNTWDGLRAEVTSCLSAPGNWEQQYSATGQLRGHREVLSKARNFYKHGHHSHSDQEDWAFQVSPTSRNRKQKVRRL